MRVPWNEPGIIGRVLDAGALGVIIPMVNSPDEARPGRRRLPLCARRARAASAPSARRCATARTTPRAANDAVACIPMIETRQAVESIDEILAVPGIDAVYVGPADLSLTYGLPPAVDNPGEPFDGALATVVAACQRQGVVPGIHANAALAAKRQAAGFRMVTVASDATVAVQGLRAALETARPVD